MLMLAMGSGFDIARLHFITSIAQSQADLAVQAGVNRAYTLPLSDPNSGSLNLLDTAIADTNKLYCDNTQTYRLNLLTTNCVPTLDETLTAGTVMTKVIGSPLQVSQFCTKLYVANTARYGLALKSKEIVIPVFMGIAGIKKFDVRIDTSALVRARTC